VPTRLIAAFSPAGLIGCKRKSKRKRMKNYKIELEKPGACPFCESDDLFCRPRGRLGHSIYCRNCGGSGPYAETKSGAIRKWNGSTYFPRHSYFALAHSTLRGKEEV